MELRTMFTCGLIGSIGGMFRSAQAYLKNNNKNKIKFDQMKFIEAVFDGFIFGFLVGFATEDPTHSIFAGFTGNIAIETIGLKKYK